jgi:multiple sugar transport system permease protein
MTAAAEPARADHTVGMSYLDRPGRRFITVGLPILVFIFVLLFPFYWMAITAVKPNHQLTDYANFNPLWVVDPTLRHIRFLLFETSYPSWLINTLIVSVAATFISLVCSVFAAYAIERIRFKGSRVTGLAIFLAYLVPPSILFIPLAVLIFRFGIYDTQARADPDLPDLPHSVLYLAADGLFPLDPV